VGGPHQGRRAVQVRPSSPPSPPSSPSAALHPLPRASRGLRLRRAGGGGGSLKQLLDDGFFHADPHSGNLLKTADGDLAYLDFGMMSELSQPRRFELIAAIVHLINRDYALLARDFQARPRPARPAALPRPPPPLRGYRPHGAALRRAGRGRRCWTSSPKTSKTSMPWPPSSKRRQPPRAAETCPVSTEGGTRRVQLVRGEWGGSG